LGAVRGASLAGAAALFFGASAAAGAVLGVSFSTVAVVDALATASVAFAPAGAPEIALSIDSKIGHQEGAT
jgi:hypothetical protein